jgi:hypothetical protein
MFVVAYLIVSATIALGLYSATSRPTPKISAEVHSRHVRTQQTGRARFATGPQPNMTHINCLS